MFRDLKIGRQIGLGFGLVVLVAALIAAFAISGLKRGAESYREYRALARASVLSGRVQANMLMASTAARDFLNTRDEKSAETFGERFAKAREFSLEQQSSMKDARRLVMSNELVESLDGYSATVAEVFELMRRRDEILYETLNPQGTRMRKNLTEIMVSANRDNDLEAAYVSGRALEHVLLGRVYLLKFLEKNMNPEVQRVRSELGVGFETPLEEMVAAIDNPVRKDRLADFMSARESFLGAFEEMVTLIEKRNALVSQKMVPLDASIADVAERIKLSLKGDQDALGPKVQESNSATVRTVILGSSIAVLLATLIAWSIVRAVTRPMAELVETVEEVQQSGDLSKRPMLRGKNEIGVMAETLGGFLASLEGQAKIARDVARGTLDTKVELLSERDTLGKSLVEMLKGITDKAKVVDDVARGDLNTEVTLASDQDSLGKSLQLMLSGLQAKARAIDDVSFGRLGVTVKMASDRDALAQSMNRMIETLQHVSQQADVISAGDYTSDISPRSDEDILGVALQRMTVTLRDNAAESDLRDWARDGQEKLSNEMRGVLERKELVTRVIGLLCRHIGAQRGAIYLCMKDSDVLEYVAGYASNDQLDGEMVFQLGEGLVGQAGQDREPIVVDRVPDDYFRIQSALGEAGPLGLALFPLCYEERLLGVIEIASIEPFEESKIDFLMAVRESICVALLAAERQHKLSTALEEGERINFLSDIALELSDCAYWHVDYGAPDYYHMSERAAQMLGEPLKADGRYHLEDEWFSRLLEADPEAAAKTSERYQGAIDGKYDKYDSTYAYKRPKDGKIIWLHAAGSIVRGEDDKIQYMYGVYQDITEQVRSEEALRKSEERFDVTVRGSGDGLWDYSPASGEMWFSDKFRELLGYSSVEEYPNVAESWSNGLHPNDREATLDAFAAHLEKKVPYDVEYQLKTKPGDYRWFRARGISLRDNEGRSYRAAGSITDITDQKEAAAKLAEAQAAAETANRAKSDFLSNMSHELRTPLNGVLGYVQILQRDRSLGAAQKKSLDSISNCGEHLLNLINDVLDLSKIEAGKMEIANKPTDLSQLLDGVRDIVKPKAESKGLTFNVKISPEVPRGIVTDAIKLRQVLINLLGNSVKFTPAGAVTLRVAEVPKGELRFEIEDSGMGIGPEKLEDIFDPFKQAEGGETEGGTGLGLAISRRIAEALGGGLTAASELGEGSCFTLTIPLEEADEINGSGVSVSVEKSAVSFSLPEGDTRSVLVADDRETNRDILNQILTDAGFEVVLVDDGDVALESLREREFDIFLCDVRMPRMNGIDVVRAIRSDEQLKSTKVIAVTASVFPEFRDKALEAGFDDFLMKPLRVAELAQTMSKFLEVEFIYPPGDEGSEPAAELDPIKVFGKLSESLVNELTEAAKIRNLTKLSEIAERLLKDEQTSAAGHHLERLVMTFDFSGIQQIVNSLASTEQGS